MAAGEGAKLIEKQRRCWKVCCCARSAGPAGRDVHDEARPALQLLCVSGLRAGAAAAPQRPLAAVDIEPTLMRWLEPMWEAR